MIFEAVFGSCNAKSPEISINLVKYAINAVKNVVISHRKVLY